jgi:hypothetical protein
MGRVLHTGSMSASKENIKTRLPAYWMRLVSGRSISWVLLQLRLNPHWGLYVVWDEDRVLVLEPVTS